MLEPEKKQANRGRGDKDAALAERAEADVKRADPAPVLVLTTEEVSPGESRAGRERNCGGDGRSAGRSRAGAPSAWPPAGGRGRRHG
jgi:hypothetical protein